MLAALTLSLQLQQTSFDLLDGVSIEVAAHNSANAPATVQFSSPAEYSIDVLRDGHVVWSNENVTPLATTFPIHARKFVSGPSVLVIYVWNGIETDGTAPAAGDYIVRARLLGVNQSPEATATLHFARPTPVAALDKLKQGDIVTIAGTLDATKGLLSDDSGAVELARRLVQAPNGPVAIRGYLVRRPDRTHVFFIQRWAPLQ
jgi:hypothetical protein